MKYRTECALSQLAPCWNMTELSSTFCNMTLEHNTDMTSIVYNRWNVSCECREVGFVWDSRFGICVDRNECLEGSHSCDVESQTCINTVGGHACCCKWGFEFDNATTKCVVSSVVQTVLDRVREPRKLNQIEKPNTKPEPLSVLMILRKVLTFLRSLFS